jgi:hypothetical protein
MAGAGIEYIIMAKTEDMAPKQRIDLRLTETQLARVGELAELLGSKQPDVLRDSIDLGLDELEQRVTRHLNFRNALKLGAKLDRRILPLHEAIARLEETGGDAEVLALLKEAIST